ncbi:VOC family protein [Vibrio sp. S9_S30]|uniref:VOC family protein n=1 Tax=Vibrio sp. S9_S30 TaxID=2720226 RepID=UPI001680A023|nr:VOC family protein [Vibrio sp. S9_S30]MBD1557168.1 VOC family protein [Vibrio sp. S9_S30]
MKLKYTILYVENVAKTLAFYERAFGLSRAMLHEGGDYGELDTGTTTLSFSSLDLMSKLGKGAVLPKRGQPSFEIAFETDNVAESLQQALDAGAELVQPVEHMPWGQTTSYVYDINGFLIEICSPVAES